MRRQRGAALMVILLIAGVMGAFFAMHALNSNTERDKVTANSLAQAKDALLGYAVTYRDRPGNTTEMFGYLPCPDIDNATATPGQADATDAACSGKDISTLRRLPWSTLGLPPLRDSAGECLWYGVSGHAKANTNKTLVFNWDSVGQFALQDANGNALHGASLHDRPLAVVFAPRGPINTTSRAGPATECQGSNTVAAYLDGADPIYAGAVPVADALSTLVLSTKASADNGSNNDQGSWITSKDIFDRIKKRSDFKADIDALIGDLATCLNNLPPASLPGASAGNKGIDNIIAVCPATAGLKTAVRTNWKDNLLYTKPLATSTVNSSTGCTAVLLFSGERTGSQSRATAAEKLTIANYLEGGNATLFPGSGTYTGTTGFASASASADIVRCIKGLPAGATQQSFANNIASFGAVGAGVVPDLIAKSVSIVDAAGTAGGCFWSPTSIPLAGKTLRAYYDFKFSFADTFALTGAGADRGKGFTLSLVRGDFLIPPTTCGTEAAMGALGAADAWGVNSIILETDVHRDAGNSDPIENHTAIMLYGNLGHTGAGDTMSTACNGSTAGCRHAPKNNFEESPLAQHNQRVEIRTGCNANCSACNPANHVAPNTYAKISTWTDCKDCNDVVVDLVGTALTPTLSRCMPLNPSMNKLFFGFTGGFRSGANQQGVTLNSLTLRSE